jgi:hypothetical protein
MCDDLFHLAKDELKKRPNQIIILTHNMSVLISGLMKNNSLTTVIARESKLISIQRMYDCDQALAIKRTGPIMEYDLETRQRKDLFNKTDLCSNITNDDTPADQFIVKYMESIQPVPLDTSPLDLKKAKRLLTDLEEVEERVHFFEATLNLFDSSAIAFQYLGDYNAGNKFHGFAVLKISPKKDCFRGVCRETKYVKLTGTFHNGVLQGIVYLTTSNDEQITYANTKDGIVHGMFITYGLTTTYKANVGAKERQKKGIIEDLKQSGIGEVAKFLNGKPVGPVWYGLVGYPSATQGYLYGQLDKKGQLTGDNIAYIYPRGKMALVGRFEDKYMKSGQVANIIKLTCKDNVLNVEFSQPAVEDTAFYFDLPTNVSLGTRLLTKDPYEAMTVILDKSSIPNSGHGLFAKRNISHSEVIAFYNGMQFVNEEEDIHDIQCFSQFSDLPPDKVDIDVKRKCHKYKISSHLGALINIPPEWDDINLYNATLAHKVNNKFEPFTNADFSFMEHPRFGVMVSIFAIKNITAGEEIFLDYTYAVNAIGKKMVPWYFQQREDSNKYSELLDKGEDVSHLPHP